ncbi:FAD-dependent oxidoreductase [Pseudothermotoga thermarum]|uniref:BFD domain protein (2Fe-2S)-binding domain protein n=1 Tax=Pseudothermotoga thermarum DSM 5069 TaxID=688269 RepID=F7YX18_9THEM|nr:FAD-dependent oxidoreductase [Pseudothermotoga thermarum]AEH50519.1 BFD domain protein (2Fe-2S)-binding domain protein [Pseudothermotoga thermarum DSM 5069]
MITTDLLVVGGGPAGLSAAVEAAKREVKVLIVDEGVQLGGQLVKQTHKFFGHEGFYASVRGYEIAEKLISQLNENVTVKKMTTVIGIYEDVVAAYDRQEDVVFKIKPRYILLATGASERFIAFENNHLPGVYGAGAVQTLMNQFKVLPGKRVLMVGSGNIGLIVSYQLLQAGAEVVAIVEIADKVGGYDVHARKVKRLGVPILLRHTIKKAIGTERVEGAIVVAVNENFEPIPGTEKEFAVDTICIAVGLQPSVELAAMAGVKIEYVPELGGFVPYRDEYMRTNVPNIFVAGDLAGIEEATTAMIEGRIVGLVVAKEVRGVDVDEELKNLQRELVEFRSGPFSDKVRKGLQRFYQQQVLPYSKEKQTDLGPVGKLRPIIECFENIPCNPCATSCPKGAIKVPDNINSLPLIDYSKCNGCGICVVKCPGLAIFMVQENYEPGYDLVGIPYEFLPVPEKGWQVVALDEEGKEICDATVVGVVKTKVKTNIVYISVPADYGQKVRSFKLKKVEEKIVCRCEEITEEQIEKAIEEGYTDYEELRRYLRLGMGPCGGRTCRSIVLSILARKAKKPVLENFQPSFRPPVMPVKMESIARGGEE